MVMHHVPPDPKCPECYAEFQAERQAESMAIVVSGRKAGDGVALEKLGIEGRHRSMKFESYHPTCEKAREALATCRAFAEKPEGNLILIGNGGNGKTHLAVSICRATGGNYSKVSRVIRNIRESYRGEGDTEQKRIDHWASRPVLALDEIGTQIGSLSEGLLLFEVLDDRYILGHPTVIVSNGTREELERVMGLKIVDRLAENGKVVVFDWDSYRRNRVEVEPSALGPRKGT
jgi:DNA replication protein DnaC